MGVRFFTKIFAKRNYNIQEDVDRKTSTKSKDIVANTEEEHEKIETKSQKTKNKIEKKNTEMNTNEQVEAAEKIAAEMKSAVKVVKKDKGLIERTESSKIVLTEDNKQVLND